MSEKKDDTLLTGTQVLDAYAFACKTVETEVSKLQTEFDSLVGKMKDLAVLHGVPVRIESEAGRMTLGYTTHALRKDLLSSWDGVQLGVDGDKRYVEDELWTMFYKAGGAGEPDEGFKTIDWDSSYCW